MESLCFEQPITIILVQEINNSERSGCFPLYRASNSQEELLFFNKKGVEIMHQKQLALKNKKLKKTFIWVFAIT